MQQNAIAGVCIALAAVIVCFYVVFYVASPMGEHPIPQNITKMEDGGPFEDLGTAFPFVLIFALLGVGAVLSLALKTDEQPQTFDPPV